MTHLSWLHVTRDNCHWFLPQIHSVTLVIQKSSFCVKEQYFHIKRPLKTIKATEEVIFHVNLLGYKPYMQHLCRMGLYWSKAKLPLTWSGTLNKLFWHFGWMESKRSWRFAVGDDQTASYYHQFIRFSQCILPQGIRQRHTKVWNICNIKPSISVSDYLKGHAQCALQYMNWEILLMQERLFTRSLTAFTAC